MTLMVFRTSRKCGTTKPTIAGGLLEDWVLQLEVLHDTARTQVKVLLHDLVQLQH